MDQSFIKNKYTIWYYLIIEFAKKRHNTTYIEKHHIIPTCLGGKNTKDNIVELLPREHYICHLLLTKMTDGQAKYKMAFALSMMHKVKNIGAGRYIPSNRLYDYARKEFKSALDNYWTDEQKAAHAEKISKATKGKTKSEEAKERLRNKHWTEKAIQNRLDNCLKAAQSRKGTHWTDSHRQSREDAYFKKNESNAKLIFDLADTSKCSINKIAKQLGIDWLTVKNILKNRDEFEKRNNT